MALIQQYLIHHENWRYNHYKQYELFMDTLTKNTLKIYSSNVALSESFIPMSDAEKQTSLFFAKDIIAGADRSKDQAVLMMSPKLMPKILTSVRTPMKDEYFQHYDTALKTRRSLSHVSVEDVNSIN